MRPQEHRPEGTDSGRLSFAAPVAPDAPASGERPLGQRTELATLSAASPRSKELMAAAALRPWPIASMTVEAPATMSPPAKTPLPVGIIVASSTTSVPWRVVYKDRA